MIRQFCQILIYLILASAASIRIVWRVGDAELAIRAWRIGMMVRLGVTVGLRVRMSRMYWLDIDLLFDPVCRRNRLSLFHLLMWLRLWCWDGIMIRDRRWRLGWIASWSSRRRMLSSLSGSSVNAQLLMG